MLQEQKPSSQSPDPFGAVFGIEYSKLSEEVRSYVDRLTIAFKETMRTLGYLTSEQYLQNWR
jgi:hypothetical protein